MQVNNNGFAGIMNIPKHTFYNTELDRHQSPPISRDSQRAEPKRRIIVAAMTSIESGEQALLRILSSHLEITEKLLFDHIQLAILVRQQMPQVVDNFLELPELKELRTSTSQLRQRVQSMLD
jgi:hypothetical protein